MTPIDYTPWIDFFRIRLTGGAAPVINPSLFVENGDMHYGNSPMYVEEVIGIDGEKHLTDINNPDLQMTVSYNVFANKKMPNGARTSAQLQVKIGAALMKNFDPIQNIAIYEISAKRRISTTQEGWRLSPIDITFKLCNINNQTGD